MADSQDDVVREVAERINPAYGPATLRAAAAAVAALRAHTAEQVARLITERDIWRMAAEASDRAAGAAQDERDALTARLAAVDGVLDEFALDAIEDPLLRRLGERIHRAAFPQEAEAWTAAQGADLPPSETYGTPGDVYT